MQAYRTETVVSEDGSLVLKKVPFQAGDEVEVIVLAREQDNGPEERYPLRGKPIRYDRPTDPVESTTLPLDTEDQIRSLVREGRIFEARNLLEAAGDLVPAGSKIREVLAPPRVRKSPEKGVDRSSEFHWLKTKADAYRGKWVALAGEDLVSCAGSLKDLLAQLDSLQLPREPLIHHVE